MSVTASQEIAIAGLRLSRIEFREDEWTERLSLVCCDCGESLCDAEYGDTLDVLARVGASHTCGVAQS